MLTCVLFFIIYFFLLVFCLVYKTGLNICIKAVLKERSDAGGGCQEKVLQ